MAKRKQRSKSEPAKPGPRGWARPYGGRAGVIIPAPEWRASTVQACGLWPMDASTGMPLVGVPLGQHLMSGATVCSDPISWFAEAGLIANPSLMVLGRAGLGKSTLIRRMITGLAAYGTFPLVVGDLKPDYRELVLALDGHVVELGRGAGKLNVLDAGQAMSVARRLTGTYRHRLLEEAHGRRLSMVSTLIRINRGVSTSDHEETILGTALRVLDETHPPGEATLLDLINVLNDAPEAVRRVTLDRGNDDRYRDTTDPLMKSLSALVEGALGDVFAARTTTPIDLTRPVCVDISRISESDERLTAAVLVACWSEGFGAIEAFQALVDAGLERQRNWLVVLDELWRVLRAGAGMGDRVDALTRLDRNKGVGTVMITHTVRDGAQSLAERIGYYALLGLARNELPALEELFDLSGRERELITSWSAPESWDPVTGRRQDPPGTGKMLIKVGSRPGIPLRVRLTHAEREIGDTNKRWTAAAYNKLRVVAGGADAS